MPVEMVSLGFTPRGRETIRRRPVAAFGDPMQPDPPLSRTVGLWTFDTKPNTTLGKVEAVYLGALDAVDQVEARSAQAKASGQFTDQVQAFFEAPEYSKILPSDLAQIRDRALRAQHGDDAVDELEEVDRGIALADRALRMAREELAVEAGVDLAKFNEAAKPHERPAGPWLKRVKQNGVEEVRVLRWNSDPNTGGTLQIPTPAELETGQFYMDIREYREAHALGDPG